MNPDRINTVVCETGQAARPCPLTYYPPEAGRHLSNFGDQPAVVLIEKTRRATAEKSCKNTCWKLAGMSPPLARI